MTTTVLIHSRNGCPYCDEARAFLSLNGIPATEIKHDDATDRAAMYDRLGLVGKARTVPQVVVTDGGEDFLIGGAHALRMSGIQSLFGGVAVALQPAVAIAVSADAIGVVADEGSSCCE